VFLLWFPTISSCYQTSRQKQRGRNCGGEVRGPLLLHTGESNTSLALSVSSCVLCGNFRCFLAIVSPYKPRTGGPVRAHLRPYEFTMELQIRTLYLVCSQAMSHSHIYMQASTPLPAPGSHGFASPQSYSSDLEVIKLPFCHLGAGLIFEPRFLPVW
jgi:hypothetical protein